MAAIVFDLDDTLYPRVRGYADTRLRTPKQPLDARNRRISIVVQNGA